MDKARGVGAWSACASEKKSTQQPEKQARATRRAQTTTQKALLSDRRFIGTRCPASSTNPRPARPSTSRPLPANLRAAYPPRHTQLPTTTHHSPLTYHPSSASPTTRTHLTHLSLLAFATTHSRGAPQAAPRTPPMEGNAAVLSASSNTWSPDLHRQVCKSEFLWT